MAEALDLRYSPEPSLQQGFLDKNTGLPLSFGLVYTFKNQSRNVLKPIFTLQEATPGGPVNYVQLPNPVVLSGIGTFQDANGDDIIPYFFPFDSTGAEELYYILVTDQFRNKQFTREAFPNPSSGGINPPGIVLTNFVANGQLLLHNGPETQIFGYIYPASAGFVYPGLYSNTPVDIFYVAQGGYTFEKSQSSTANDIISFPKITQYNGLETGSPRYSININRTSSSSDLVCDLRIKFNDVFKFTNPNNIYTFLFNAVSLSGSPLNGVEVLIIDYYGSSSPGGPTPNNSEETALPGSPINIPITETQFAIPFTFPLDPNALIGNNDDDYVQIAIRFPTIGLFQVQLTDFMLVPDNQIVGLSFPVETNGEFFESASFNNAPNNYSLLPDHSMPGTPSKQPYYFNQGFDLYLPVVQTGQGMSYDFSQIGKIETYSMTSGFVYNSMLNSINNGTNLLLCDGSFYITGAYSFLGIPYARLQQQLFDTVSNVPIYGTGANFVTSAIYASNPLAIRIWRNEPFVEIPTIGATINPTGFTVVTRNVGSAVSIGMNGFITGTVAAGMAVWGNVIGNTVTNAIDGAAPTGYILAQQVNTPRSRQIWTLDASAVGVPPNSSYYQFGSTTTAFFMWFSVNNTGVMPVVVGTPIQCNISSSFTNVDCINVIQETLNGWQISDVVVTGLPPAGSFFSFFARGLQYNVWYTINGAGTSPATPTGANIVVPLLTTDNGAMVATKTKIAINSYQFAVPQLQGLFVRGYDPNALIDPFSKERFSPTNGSLYNGDKIGTYQFQDVQQHIHSTTDGPGISNFITDFGTFLNVAATGTKGTVEPFTGYNAASTLLNQTEMGWETRPMNMYVNYVIRY